MGDLRDIETWRRELGLLPIPLRDHQEEASYVMLDGSRGNFCLYLDGRVLTTSMRDQAWSANVDHAVTLGDQEVRVLRWDRPQQYFTIAYSLIHSSPDLFHRRLEQEAPLDELSVISHAIHVFRGLRNVLGPREEGGTALKAFLYLLAAAVEGHYERNIDLKSWRLDPETERVARSISESEWESLFTTLRRGPEADNLNPDLSLTLRHASGVLFQEAHYAAVFEPFYQRTLPGIAPRPVSLEPTTSYVGVHFTPIAVVRTVVEESLAALADLPQYITIFDPACGSGEFLREALRQLKLRGFPGQAHLIGFDVSPAACAMAEFALGWEARNAVDRTVIDIRCCDALAEETSWPVDVDLALMNPPFVAWRDLTARQEHATKRILGEHATLRPDLSTAFLWRAAQSLGSTAALGAVLPSSFLGGVSFRSLREALGQHLAARLIARLGSHELFPNARVDVSLYVGGRGIGAEVPLAVWADHRITSTSAALRALRRYRASQSTMPTVLQGEGYSIYPTDTIGRREESWTPRPYESWKLAHSLHRVPRVRDLFSVQQGTITGLNRVFLVRKAEWELIEDRERPYFRPCSLNDSIRSGRLYDDWYVFYPHGPYELDTESALRSTVPGFYQERLQPNKNELQKRRRIPQERWWVLSEHRAWQRQPTIKIISTYFGDAGSFAWDSEGRFVVVQGYGWLPRRSKGRVRLSRTIWLAYLALLNSDVFSSLLAANSDHVGGGQWNLSKRFVELVPLPNLTKTTLVSASETNDLARLGLLIHQAGLEALSVDSAAKLGELAQAVYFLEAREEADGGKTHQG